MEKIYHGVFALSRGYLNNFGENLSGITGRENHNGNQPVRGRGYRPREARPMKRKQVMKGMAIWVMAMSK